MAILPSTDAEGARAVAESQWPSRPAILSKGGRTEPRGTRCSTTDAFRQALVASARVLVGVRRNAVRDLHPADQIRLARPDFSRP